VRWILSCLDRLPSNELTMTHELIAEMLGVRRVGVTQAAGKLQAAGLIHYSRGHMSYSIAPTGSTSMRVYAVVKREYDRLLRPETLLQRWWNGTHRCTVRLVKTAHAELTDATRATVELLAPMK